VDQPDHDRAIARRRRNSLDRSMPDVADREHGGQAGLQEKRTTIKRPAGGSEINARHHKPPAVTLNVCGQPVRARLGADQREQRLGGNGFLAARTAILQGQELKAPTSAAADYLYTVSDRDGR